MCMSVLCEQRDVCMRMSYVRLSMKRGVNACVCRIVRLSVSRGGECNGMHALCAQRGDCMHMYASCERLSARTEG
jgi:hypothetical protein